MAELQVDAALAVNTVFNPAGLSSHDAGASRFLPMSVSSNPQTATVDRPRRLADTSAVAAMPTLPVMTTRDVLVTEDVIGSGPRCMPAHTRASAALDTADVPGALTRRRVPEQAHSGHLGSMRLDASDIEGTRPSDLMPFRTRRITDPLAPDYKLTVVPPKPASPPAFKRDFMNMIDDIEGTKPVAFPSKVRPRDDRNPLDTTDIEGSRTGTTRRAASLGATSRPRPDPLDVRDICDTRFKTQRRTNPLDPVYQHHGQVVASEPGMRPTPAPAASDEAFWRPLHVKDIPGTAPGGWGSTKVGGVKQSERKDFRVTNDLSDMLYSQAGSKKPGLANDRGTDPNDRNYLLLEGRELGPEELRVGRNWYGTATALLARDGERAVAASLGADAAALGDTAAGSSLALMPDQVEPPTLAFAKKLVEPRDAEIAALRGQLTATTRASRALSEGATARLHRTTVETLTRPVADNFGGTLVHRPKGGRKHGFTPLIPGEPSVPVPPPKTIFKPREAEIGRLSGALLSASSRLLATANAAAFGDARGPDGGVATLSPPGSLTPRPGGATPGAAAASAAASRRASGQLPSGAVTPSGNQGTHAFALTATVTGAASRKPSLGMTATTAAAASAVGLHMDDRRLDAGAKNLSASVAARTIGLGGTSSLAASVGNVTLSRGMSLRGPVTSFADPHEVRMASRAFADDVASVRALS